MVYFAEYFKCLRARTIVIEPEYVDRDFLDDHADYYVRCFHPYRRYCARLHFFESQFDQHSFQRLLEGDPGGPITQTALQMNNYLGFIIVKPLPEAIIGRSCLKHYPPDGGRRYFPTARTYSASLCGLKLEVETVAFQEQDTVAAACATSALWSAFHCTGRLFQHEIPTPISITRRATEKVPVYTRAVPSEGLALEQMAAAVRGVGLEPLLFNVEVDPVLLPWLAYAYIKAKIPCLMICSLHDCSSSSPDRLGLHAVTLTGFSLGRPNCPPVGGTGFPLRASRIDELYAHDDQVGPFARMVFDGCQRNSDSLSTSWRSPSSGRYDVRACPQSLLVPLYHKIRISYREVLDQIIDLDASIRALDKEVKQSNRKMGWGEFEWDLYLCTANDFKASLFSEKAGLSGPYRRSILERHLPRFLWLGKALSGNRPVLEFLFDATGIARGKYLIMTIAYDADTVNKICRAVRTHKSTIKAKYPDVLAPLQKMCSDSRSFF